MTISDFEHVILLAHGSSDAMWKVPFETLYDTVSTLCGGERVSLAYMELCEPDLAQAINALPDTVRSIAVLPLFLAAGKHLRQDVPKQIEALTSNGRQVQLLPPVGEDKAVQEAMQAIIARQLGLTS